MVKEILNPLNQMPHKCTYLEVPSRHQRVKIKGLGRLERTKK
jgi:hypothetical protein